MDLIVKICGLSTEETLDAALAAGAEMVGLNFFPKSPRYVSLDKAARLARLARGRAEIVALTVDMDDAALDEVMKRIKPDWLQLHGKETPERAAFVRNYSDTKVMKAIGVSTASDLAAAKRYAAVADRLLLDAKPPKDADRPGGHGRAFDWTILRGFDAGVPYLLSGGLNPLNVEEAIVVTGAPGVDVSSGVETAPGKKDTVLISAFVKNARAAVAERAKETVSS